MKADFLKADVALGGDVRQVVRVTNQTWPDICVMREIHGDDSVSNIVVTHTREANEFEEVARIRATYPEAVVQRLYPGMNPNIKFVAPDYIDREVPKEEPAKPAKHRAAKAEVAPAEPAGVASAADIDAMFASEANG